jgi:exonuclease III
MMILKVFLRLYHQNIRGIKGKIEEIMIHLAGETPNIICLMEHHLRDFEINITCFSMYKLGAKFCRKNLKNGGVCIFIREDLKFTTINVQTHCKEQDLEIAVIQIRCKGSKLNIITLYRAPTGDFDYFINKLDLILNSLAKYNTEFIIRGDININYLGKKLQECAIRSDAENV